MSAPSHDTVQRLLEAAGQVFAERGFAEATVRDICERAGANVAAINYHFRDKLGLYQAVFRHAATCGDAALQPLHQFTTVGTPAQRLQAWTASFLRDLVAKDRAGWPGRLMARELADPTPLLIEFIERGARPRFEALLDILAAVRPEVAPDHLRRCAASVIGQVIFYHHGKPFIERLDPANVLTEERVAVIAAHITDFSLAGVAALSSSPEPSTQESSS